MKKNSIYALSALAVITIAGVSFTIGKLYQDNKFVEKSDSLIDITDEYKGNTTEEKNSNVSSIEESKSEDVSESNSQTPTSDNKSEIKYTIIENKDKGTYEVKINNKIVVKDLKDYLGETGKYLIYAQIGENNIPDSEILDWDIAFINKFTGKVTILKDVLYLEDPYAMESQFYSIIDNTFYGVVENEKKLYKIDLNKDTITKDIISKSPTLKNIAGFYSKVDLLFVVDKNGDVLSYNDATKEFKKHSYTAKSTGNVLNFSDIYDTDEFTKDLQFVENHDNKDGLLLYVNRYEDYEDGAFFEYNKAEGNFYLMD